MLQSLASRLAIASLVLALAVPARAARPDVVVYGANWCKPCHAVRGFLRANGIAFEYYDVDEKANAQAFSRISGPDRAIPLTLVGGQPVRGANLDQLATLLRAGGYQVTRPAPGQADGAKYGGWSLEWWKKVVAVLQRRIETVRPQVVQHGVELLHKRDELEMLEATLAQVRKDALAAGVPEDAL